MSEVAKYQNVFRGILVSGVVTFAAYLITWIISQPVGFFIVPRIVLDFDLLFLLGTILGVIYFMKRRRQDQSILLYGITVGIVGGILSAIFISIFQWIILVYIIYFFQYLLACLISGVFIGFLVGVLISVYYMYKEVKAETPEKKADDEFFKSLIED